MINSDIITEASAGTVAALYVTSHTSSEHWRALAASDEVVVIEKINFKVYNNNNNN